MVRQIAKLRTALAATVLLAAISFVTPVCAELTGETKSSTPILSASLTKTREPFWKRITISPAFNIYSPSNQRVRSHFGSSWKSISLDPGLKDEDDLWRGLNARLEYIEGTSGGNRALMIPVGLSYRGPISKLWGISTFAGVGASVYIVDLKSKMDGVNTGLRTMLGGEVFLDANLGRHFTLETSYHVMSRVNGFDLSGLNTSVCVRF